LSFEYEDFIDFVSTIEVYAPANNGTGPEPFPNGIKEQLIQSPILDFVQVFGGRQLLVYASK
jgi:hypothetical protein